jgi:hypothetical protein
MVWRTSFIPTLAPCGRHQFDVQFLLGCRDGLGIKTLRSGYLVTSAQVEPVELDTHSARLLRKWDLAESSRMSEAWRQEYRTSTLTLPYTWSDFQWQQRSLKLSFSSISRTFNIALFTQPIVLFSVIHLHLRTTASSPPPRPHCIPHFQPAGPHSSIHMVTQAFVSSTHYRRD